MSRGTVCKLRLVLVVPLVLFVGMALADVEMDMVAGVVRFVPRDTVEVAACVGRAAGAYRWSGGPWTLRLMRSCTRWRGCCGLLPGTVRKLPLAWGVQLVLIVGVTAADVAADEERDAVAGVVRLIVRAGVHVAACVCRAVCAFFRPAGGRGGVVCSAGRYARCGACLACSWCCLSASRWRTWGWTWWRGWCGLSGGTVCTLRRCLACRWCLLSSWRWRTWRWTWWRGWCGLSRGTVCKLRLVFVEQLVLVVGVAAAEVAMDVVVVAAVRFVPRHGLRGPTCFASWASWRRSEWRPLAGLGT